MLLATAFQQALTMDITEVFYPQTRQDWRNWLETNGNNQLWAVPNVFVTDGACMASSACQNPSLTYMALTARAADIAVQKLKRGEL